MQRSRGAGLGVGAAGESREILLAVVVVGCAKRSASPFSLAIFIYISLLRVFWLVAHVVEGTNV